MPPFAARCFLQTPNSRLSRMTRAAVRPAAKPTGPQWRRRPIAPSCRKHPQPPCGLRCDTVRKPIAIRDELPCGRVWKRRSCSGHRLPFIRDDPDCSAECTAVDVHSCLDPQRFSRAAIGRHDRPTPRIEPFEFGRHRNENLLKRFRQHAPAGVAQTRSHSEGVGLSFDQRWAGFEIRAYTALDAAGVE